MTDVFNHFVHLYSDEWITRDELFGSLTGLLSHDPSLLREALKALSGDVVLHLEFIAWLSDLTTETRISLGHKTFTVSAALVSRLDRELRPRSS